LIPFIVIAIANGTVILLFMLGKLTFHDLDEVTDGLITIAVGILAIFLIVHLFCLNIRPVERFQDASASLSSLWTGIVETEKDICTLMTRADNFIQNQVGQPGHDNPQLVASAQQQARDKAGGQLTDCTTSGGDEPNGTLSDAENRIARMEVTLNGFTAPAFQQALKASQTCESFDDSTTLTDLQSRLATVRATIQQQQRQYLKPVDDKQAAMQRGELSDCDRQKGATSGAGVVGGGGGGRGTAGQG